VCHDSSHPARLERIAYESAPSDYRHKGSLRIAFLPARLSVGIEDIEDLIFDLESALKSQG